MAYLMRAQEQESHQTVFPQRIPNCNAQNKTRTLDNELAKYDL